MALSSTFDFADLPTFDAFLGDFRQSVVAIQTIFTVVVHILSAFAPVFRIETDVFWLQDKVFKAVAA